MDTPDTIWLDERVLKTLNTERDPDCRANQIGYIRAGKAKEAVNKAVADCVAQIPSEFVIQIIHTSTDSGVFALTNHGRIFEEVAAERWELHRGPEL